jgi:hypothetical protein
MSVLGAVSAPLLLSACGNYHEDYSGMDHGADLKQGGNCATNGVTPVVEMLHDPNHDLTIPASDVAAGVQKTYLLGDNGSGHVHEITLTAAHFANLQTGQGVQVLSTESGHSHHVTVNC